MLFEGRTQLGSGAFLSVCVRGDRIEAGRVRGVSSFGLDEKKPIRGERVKNEPCRCTVFTALEFRSNSFVLVIAVECTSCVRGWVGCGRSTMATILYRLGPRVCAKYVGDLGPC